MTSEYDADHKADHDPSNAEEPDLLWRLGRRLDPPEDEGGVRSPPTDAELVAYRKGELDDGRRQAVEAALAEDDSARRRLAELAGRGVQPPHAEARERALEAFDRSFAQPPAGRLLAWRRAPRRLVGGLALAAAVILVASLWLLPGSPIEPLPTDLAWSVTATGSADMRSEPIVSTTSIRVTREGRLRIEVTPDRAIAEIDFAVYRQDPSGSVVPVDAADKAMTIDRGAAVLDAVAGDVIGEGDGPWRVAVVVARAGGLPSASAVEAALAGEHPAAAAWRLHTLDVALVPAP